MTSIAFAGCGGDSRPAGPGGGLRIAAHGVALGGLLARDPFAHGRRVALGINTDSAPGPSIETYMALVGRKPKIFMWYQQWSEPLFYLSQLRPVAALGVVPMITWNPTIDGHGIPLSDIAAGRYDTYIRAAARRAAAWKQLLYVRFAPEMNLKGSPYGPGRDGNTAASYTAAWRHVVGIFRAEDATNVEWVWSPNVDCMGHCPFGAFYPGDAWVDWVALDGYNYANLDNDPWLSFAEVFASSYKSLTDMTARPVMIGETSSSDLGGSKAQWIRGIRPALATQFPRIRALIWFDHIKETDWRINSSPQSLAAFRALAHSPIALP